jgi:hypothetical protein
MNGLTKVVLGAACALGLTATAASAAIVCNEDGDCWHTKRVYHYRPEFRLEVHPDNWRWEGRRHHWREHAGRGYWRNGVWIEF